MTQAQALRIPRCAPGCTPASSEIRGDDIGGIGVHIGARVSALAGPNDVLVSSTLRDLVIGSGLPVRGPRHSSTQRRSRGMAASSRSLLREVRHGPAAIPSRIRSPHSRVLHRAWRGFRKEHFISLKGQRRLHRNARHRHDCSSHQARVVNHGVVADAGQGNPGSAGQPFACRFSVYRRRDKSINFCPYESDGAWQGVHRLHRVTPRHHIVDDRAAPGIGEVQIQCSDRAQPLAMTHEVAQDDATSCFRLEHERRKRVNETKDFRPKSDSF